MSKVLFRIQPPLPEDENGALSVGGTLSYEDFFGLSQKYISEYVVCGQIIDYRKNDLYYIYVDICEEIDRLNASGDHDITMSFYPVLRVFDMGGDDIRIDNVSDNAPEPRIASALGSRNALLDQLLKEKRKIESFVGRHQPTLGQP